MFAGYTLNRQSYPGEYARFAQEAVDEIEYATGDVNTKWGAERAKDGHPAPFKISYVEVGNEDQFACLVEHVGVRGQSCDGAAGILGGFSQIVAVSLLQFLIPHMDLDAFGFHESRHEAEKCNPRGSGIGRQSADELAMLRLYRECDPEDRQMLLRTARRLARH